WREGAVTISPTKNAAPARQNTARTSRRVMWSLPLERDDFLEAQGTEGHHSEARVDQHVTRLRVVERFHVGRVDDRDRRRDEEGERDERVGARASHRGQALHLAEYLLPLADRVGDHVDEPREAAADLLLDLDRGDHEVEVLRPESFGHVREGRVEGLPEAGLGGPPV